MPRTYISYLKNGDTVEDTFLVLKKEVKETKGKKLYLSLQLTDKTGYIEARRWDATPELCDSFEKDNFISIKGKVETFNGTLQINITELTRIAPENVQMSEFVPSTENDIPKMLDELKEIIATIQDPYLSKLLNAFFTDESFCKVFSTVPAAMQNHHAFLGGLLEHVLSVATMAISLSKHYPMIKRDLLITGVILHDIGKTRELSYERSFQYTDEGQLTGHLISGVLMVYEKALKIEGFPPDLLNVLFHLILSHHGEHEWGSPVKPGTPEAIALHHLDNLDAKMQAAAKAVLEHKDTSSSWTEYVKMFERRLYKK
ncbi:MAG: 3'-5' exoribonuclease YhaM family protein [Candidatus Loosdrechtia sp.]|uniref:3'-5' exoribonuclease YhaM family protein n=1 Tax=Candidatus Loosdrechtia sp. TaxID=3101272 RepID=UPI003A751450|nr:MAG: HD domain-containing protein [Candidatus Jettenia sp. AMX2]